MSFSVNYTVAVAPVPAGFGRVAAIGSDPAGFEVVLRGGQGVGASVSIELDFLSGCPADAKVLV